MWLANRRKLYVPDPRGEPTNIFLIRQALFRLVFKFFRTFHIIFEGFFAVFRNNIGQEETAQVSHVRTHLLGLNASLNNYSFSLTSKVFYGFKYPTKKNHFEKRIAAGDCFIHPVMLFSKPNKIFWDILIQTITFFETKPKKG